MRRLAHNDHGIHAILLYGAAGTGKSELARLITELWLCTNVSDEGADGTCRACTAFQRGNSSDVLNLDPVGNSSIINVKQIANDNIREGDPPLPLLKFFRTPPLMSRHKIGLIFDAHRMNYHASNALLKTLEEPHPHAKLILTTDSVGSLLPTILSRCLAVACEAPTVDELRVAFPSASDDEIRLAEGTPGRLTHMEARREVYARLLEFARRLHQRHPGEALAATDEFASIADSLGEAAKLNARAADAHALDALATFFARESYAPPAWTHLIIEAHRRILGNGNPTIVYDALFSAMLGSK